MSPLEELKKEIIEDKELPLQDGNLVFGEGNPNAEVLFIGEAPGKNEDEQKRPFVGRSGKLLDSLIEGINWSRKDVYITNVVKRRPPQNRDPHPEEIVAYTPYLKRQIEIINPKVIVPLGRFAMAHFIPDGKISRDQGQLFWWRNRLVMPMYHPAAAFRRGSLLENLKESFDKLPKLIKDYPNLLKEKLSSKI